MKIIRINPNTNKKKDFLLLIASFFSFFVFFRVPHFASRPPEYSAGIFGGFFASAQSPESTAASEEAADEKVQGIREAVKEKVREKLEEVQRGEKKAFTGKINEITNSTLILTSQDDKKQAKVDKEATIIINQNRKTIELEDLEIGSYVIAMGYLEDIDLLDAKRIVVSEEPKPLDREAIFGTVSDISSEEKIISVKGLKQNLVYTLEITTKTKVTQKVADEIEEIEFADIAEGSRLVAVGKSSENEEKIITAKIIYVLSGEEAFPTEEPTPAISPTPIEEAEETE